MGDIRVECYSGHKAGERPLRFTASGHTCAVQAIEDKWYSPDAAYFKVTADDGNVYILRHDEHRDVWSIEAFRTQR